MTIASHRAARFAQDLRVLRAGMRRVIRIDQRFAAHTAFTGGCATP